MKSAKDYKVKIKVGDSQVEVEGAEGGVVKIVEALSEVLRGSRRSASPDESAPQPSVTVPAHRASHTDIRSFFAEKRPSSDVEAAAVAAYYYQYLAPESAHREAIDSAGLQEAFRQARRPLPRRTIFTLQNARNAGYLDSAGGGQYRLNPVGYNLVEHTLGPAQAAEGPSPKRKPTKTARKLARK